MRVLIFIVALIAAGFSYPALLIHDAARRRNFLKSGTPAVDDSYARVRAPGRTYHDLKNVAVEWTRADPQQAAKFLAGLFVWSWALHGLASLARVVTGYWWP
jgi:hypothetical protein